MYVLYWPVKYDLQPRYEGIKHLMSKYISIVKDSKGRRAIQIYLEKEKNKQLHKGQYRMLPESPGEIIKPLSLTLLYFKRAGFTLNKRDNYICCWSQGKNADGMFSLHYTTVIANGKSLVKQLGFDIRYRENSAQRLGASNARLNNVPMDVIEEVGGWKTHQV